MASGYLIFHRPLDGHGRPHRKAWRYREPAKQRDKMFETKREAQDFAIAGGFDGEQDFIEPHTKPEYAKPEYDVTDPTTGHKIKPRPEPIKQRKARIDGPTATYIVAFANTASHPTRPGIVERVKVGTTITKNRSTYGITLGLDVKECVPPEIHPDRLTAETRALVIESKLDRDGMFVRVADEAFAPTISLTYDELVAWVEGAIYDEH